MTHDSKQTSQIKHDTNYHLLLERGRRFQILHGGFAWEAVYWGSDDSGAIVAYLAGKHWQFTHYDLKNITGKLVVGDLLARTEIQAIEQDYLATHKITE